MDERFVSVMGECDLSLQRISFFILLKARNKKEKKRVGSVWISLDSFELLV